MYSESLFNLAGIADLTNMRVILVVQTPIFYDGVSDYTYTNFGIDYSGGATYVTTSLGDLYINSVSGTSTFTATLGTPAVVPEPSCFALTGLGGLGLMIAKCRRRTAKAAA